MIMMVIYSDESYPVMKTIKVVLVKEVISCDVAQIRFQKKSFARLRCKSASLYDNGIPLRRSGQPTCLYSDEIFLGTHMRAMKLKEVAKRNKKACPVPQTTCFWQFMAVHSSWGT